MKLKRALTLVAATTLTPLMAHAADPAPARESDAVAHVAEIVVTAQRRDETLTDVPIAITAKTGADLSIEGVRTSMDLGLVTPGLYYAQQGNSAEPTIRGVGTAVTTPGADANVALYIDDIYQPNQTANNFQFNDVQNIEVLKGPQGTLYGRNATGGTIAVKTFDPSQTPSGDVYLSYGSYNDLTASVYGNAPITDHLAGNISIFADHDDGFMRNTYANEEEAQDKTIAVRGKVLWEASDKLTFVLGANYASQDNNAPFSNRVVNGDNSLAFQVAQAGLNFPTGTYQTATALVPQVNTQLGGVNLHAKYDTGSGIVTSITSYQVTNNQLQVDVGYAPIYSSGIYIWDEEKTFTQEVNFASKQIGPISFIAGAFYYHDWSHINLNVAVAQNPIHVLVDELGLVKTDAVSGFAEANWDITSQLRLILGGRYSTESKTQSGCDAFPTVLTSDGGACLAVTDYGPHTNTWDTFDPRVVLQYKPDRWSQIYASYAVGDKSGNYNLGVTTPVKPEKNDAYEIGYKRHQGPITFDISGYYYKYTNLQVQTLTGENAAVLTNLTNAAAATIYGVDGDITAVINPNWKVNVGGAWLHGTYDKFPGATLTTPTFECAVGATIIDPTGPCTTVGTTYSTGNAQVPVDASGKNIIRAPQVTFDATLLYSHPLPLGRFDGSVTVAYNGGFYWDPDNQFKEPAYTIVNAKLTWVLPGDRYRISAWGQNLANQKYDVWVAPSGSGTTEVLGRPVAAGVSLEIKL